MVKEKSICSHRNQHQSVFIVLFVWFHYLTVCTANVSPVCALGQPALGGSSNSSSSSRQRPVFLLFYCSKRSPFKLVSGTATRSPEMSCQYNKPFSLYCLVVRRGSKKQKHSTKHREGWTEQLVPCGYWLLIYLVYCCIFLHFFFISWVLQREGKPTKKPRLWQIKRQKTKYKREFKDSLRSALFPIKYTYKNPSITRLKSVE